MTTHLSALEHKLMAYTIASALNRDDILITEDSFTEYAKVTFPRITEEGITNLWKDHLKSLP